jgi:hypothetical protein
MIPPSILSHMMGGAILLIIFILIIMYFSKLQALDIYHRLVILILLSIMITVHGISHIGLEAQYKYIPVYSWINTGKYPHV